ncbi:MAG: DNA alkylation repair protein [Bacteroidia bacterium]
MTTKLQELYLEHGEPERAAYMQAYLKDHFECYGLDAPKRRALDKAFFAENALPTAEELPQVLSECWAAPQREMQHVGMEMMEKLHKKWTIETIDLLEMMIVEKSWWDTVDFIASHLVAKYFQKFPQQIAPITEKWMETENMWLQRSCLIFQLFYKDKTDFPLLLSFIEHTCHSNEFFLQKAIGWALRQYARTDPEGVRDAVNRLTLKPLSKREAMKHL